MSLDQLMSTLVDMEKEMKQAARSLDFEHAAIVRDELARLKKLVPAEQRRKSP
jgi:excinuclease UvrABC helicase subunit UvrB